MSEHTEQSNNEQSNNEQSNSEQSNSERISTQELSKAAMLAMALAPQFAVRFSRAATSADLGEFADHDMMLFHLHTASAELNEIADSNRETVPSHTFPLMASVSLASAVWAAFATSPRPDAARPGDAWRPSIEQSLFHLENAQTAFARSMAQLAELHPDVEALRDAGDPADPFDSEPGARGNSGLTPRKFGLHPLSLASTTTDIAVANLRPQELLELASLLAQDIRDDALGDGAQPVPLEEVREVAMSVRAGAREGWVLEEYDEEDAGEFSAEPDSSAAPDSPAEVLQRETQRLIYALPWANVDDAARTAAATAIGRLLKLAPVEMDPLVPLAKKLVDVDLVVCLDDYEVCVRAAAGLGERFMTLHLEGVKGQDAASEAAPAPSKAEVQALPTLPAAMTTANRSNPARRPMQA